MYGFNLVNEKAMDIHLQFLLSWMETFDSDISLKNAIAAKEKIPKSLKKGLTQFGRQIAN